MTADASLEPPKMIATNEEMDAARIPVAYRDYCAHLFIKFQGCLRKEFFHWRCHHEELEWEHCSLAESQRKRRVRDKQRMESYLAQKE